MNNAQEQDYVSTNLQNLRYFEAKGFSPQLRVGREYYSFSKTSTEEVLELMREPDCTAHLTISPENNFVAIHARTPDTLKYIEGGLTRCSFQVMSKDERQCLFIYQRDKSLEGLKKNSDVKSPCGTGSLAVIYSGLIPMPDFYNEKDGTRFTSVFPSTEGMKWRELSKIKRGDIESMEVRTELWFGPMKELPNTKVVTNPLPPEAYPKAFRDSIIKGGLRLQTHPEYIALGYLVSAGRLCGKKVVIHPSGENEDFYEYAVLQGIAVGEPDWNKSPALDFSIEPLMKVKEKRRERLAAEIQAYFEAKDNAEVQRLALDRLIQKATIDECGYLDESENPATEIPTAIKKPASGRRKLSLDELKKKKAKILEDLKAKRVLNIDYTVEDITREKLEEIHEDNPDGLLGFYDEIGWLFDELRGPNAHKWRTLIQKGYYGKYRHDTTRMKRQVSIPALTFMLLGGTQFSTYKNHIEFLLEKNKHRDGTDSRILKVGPNYRPRFDAKAVNSARDEKAEKLVNNVFEVLDDDFHFKMNAHGKGKFDKNNALIIGLSPEAQALFDTFRIESKRLADAWAKKNIMMAYFIGKFRPNLARIALIYHCVEWADQWSNDPLKCPEPTLVSADTMRRALCFAEACILWAQVIYGNACKPEIEAANTLLDNIRRGLVKHNANIRSDITKRGMAGTRVTEVVDAAVQILVRCNYVRVSKISAGKGRPSEHLYLNDKLLYEVAADLPVSELLEDEGFSDNDKEDEHPAEYFKSKWLKTESEEDPPRTSESYAGDPEPSDGTEAAETESEELENTEEAPSQSEVVTDKDALYEDDDFFSDAGLADEWDENGVPSEEVEDSNAVLEEASAGNLDDKSAEVESVESSSGHFLPSADDEDHLTAKSEHQASFDGEECNNVRTTENEPELSEASASDDVIDLSTEPTDDVTEEKPALATSNSGSVKAPTHPIFGAISDRRTLGAGPKKPSPPKKKPLPFDTSVVRSVCLGFLYERGFSDDAARTAVNEFAAQAGAAEKFASEWVELFKAKYTKRDEESEPGESVA